MRFTTKVMFDGRGQCLSVHPVAILCDIFLHPSSHASKKVSLLLDVSFGNIVDTKRGNKHEKRS